MRKVTELKGYSKSDEVFAISPAKWGFDCVSPEEATKEMEEAKELAKEVDGICVAILTSEDGIEKVIGENIKNGSSERMLLFNAVETERENSELRILTFNCKKGSHQKAWWYDKRVKYQKESIV